ncbi:MAG: hypothetical protein ACJA11_003368 [Glaciecola sp.]|jgi:hypothetical protein
MSLGKALPAKSLELVPKRYNAADSLVDKRQTMLKFPVNKLSELEENRVLSIANSKDYADLPPSQTVPKLADDGIHLASESTIYRLLTANDQLAKCTSTRVYNHPKPLPFVATGPNQIYTWDITYLPTDVQGIFLYLCMVMDIYSLKIVNWPAHANKSSAFGQ